jgi:hypothetical protein
MRSGAGPDSPNTNSIVQHAVLTITSLAQLRQTEAEIVGRLATSPLISELFLLDPIRALAEVNVSLTPVAVGEWEDAAPAIRQRAGIVWPDRYDRVKALGGTIGLRVRVSSILAPPGFNAAAEDAEIIGSFTGQITDPGRVGG